MKWYVLQVKDFKVAQWNLENQGFEVFSPLYKDEKGTRSLFPGYMFVHLDLETTAWRKVNGTRGVRRIMCMDSERPSPVRDSVMQYLMENEIVEKVEDVLSAGDRVTLLEGPFKEHTGVCEWTDKKRISLLLHLLGGSVRVQVNLGQVKKTTSASKGLAS